MAEIKRGPGVTVPWEEFAKKMEPFTGDVELIKSNWEKVDAFAYLYLWWWVQR
ncbi:MAG TPA: hypothetical protein GXX34_11130 [Clostridia bacterium]|nr:hypothetical protein [Clostridia bacterium]